MFTSEIDRRVALSDRNAGIFIGTAILVAIVVACVSARTLAFTLPVVAVSFLVAAAWSGRLGEAAPAGMRAPWWICGFLVYATLSATWALDPQIALLGTGSGLLIVLGCSSMIRLIEGQTRLNLLHVGEGLWVGVLLGSAFLLLELLSGQALTMLVMNALGMGPENISKAEYFEWREGRIVAISAENVTRNLAPIALFMWPALAAVSGGMPRGKSLWLRLVIFCVTAGAVMVSWHESSKLAIVAGAAAFMLASLAPRLTHRLTCIGWVVSCWAVLPAVLLAYKFDLHSASWLQSSAQHRIIIWNYTAEETLKSPWIGVGARSTRVLGPATENDLEQPAQDRHLRTLSLHAHNAFLQTWFELGVIGVTLLSLAGVALIQGIQSLPARSRKYALAAFVASAAMLSTSYGMWQYWFMCMFGFVAVFTAIGARLIATAPGQRDNEA